MKYPYCAYISSRTREFGNQMAVVLDPEGERAASTFDYALEATKNGETFYFIETLLKQPGFDAITTFNAGGYPQVFRDAGVADETIDYARTQMAAVLGARGDMEGGLRAYLTVNGYEVMP